MNKRDYSFSVFESTITYAVDEYSDENRFSITKDIGLNESTFFSEIYLNRVKKEQQLLKEIRKDQAQLVILGNPGTGKTTILRKVLHSLVEEGNIYSLYIDFKKVTGINDESNSKYESLSNFIQKYLTTKLQSYFNTINITDNTIVDFLVEQSDYLYSEDFDNPEFITIFRKLQSIFDFDKKVNSQESFIEWFRTQRNESKSEEFRSLFLKLSNSLKPNNYFRYISFKLDKQCVLSFDNVDSIIDNSIRDEFCVFFRKYQSVLKSSVKSIISIRSKNVSINGLSDIGSYIVQEFSIDYKDFIDEEIFDDKVKLIINQNGFCSADQKVKIESDLLKTGKEKFAKSMYEQRIDFIKKYVNSSTTEKVESQNKNETIHIESVKELESYSKLLLDTEKLRVAFLDLSNYDRREMLINIINFIYYLKEEINLKIDLLNSNRDRQQFILESYFYGWSNTKGIFIPQDIYNIPQDVQNWLEGNKNALDCSLDHLILISIFNLSKQTIVRSDFSFDRKTYVSLVVKNLEDLGYDEETIKQRIFYLIKDSHLNFDKGIIELSHFIDINSYNDIKLEDEISITPRAYYLISYSHLKFISIISQMRSSKIKVNGSRFNFNDIQPITVKTIYAFLRLLAHMAHMHLNGLNSIKTKLINKGYKDWFIHYRKTFCLKSNGHYTPLNDDNPNLMFLNILNSCQIFLKREFRIEEDYEYFDYNKGINNKLELLEDYYIKSVKEILNNSFTEKNGEDLIKEFNIDSLKHNKAKKNRGLGA
ncbi:ATP-binding protein [Psychroserpens ponticola]|uniref:ATP-binding protein n=1 Tax=Psychroserpens ponticola TaxID=2932268 RepID=A0ABY7RTY5_9FLAO|nr:ATP-binding protein [Psychroserpens ponticola]WCO00580.1 ATP-binding protein [Psychroserpens ponticola]